MALACMAADGNSYLVFTGECLQSSYSNNNTLFSDSVKYYKLTGWACNDPKHAAKGTEMFIKGQIGHMTPAQHGVLSLSEDRQKKDPEANSN